MNLLALAAMTVAVAMRSPLPAFVFAVAVFGMVLWRDRHAVAGMRMARILAALAILVAAWDDSGVDRWPLLVAGLLIVFYLIYADVVKRALDVRFLETINLDVRRSWRERLKTPPVIAAIMNSLIAAYGLAAIAGIWPAVGAADPVVLVLTVAALLWTGSVVLANALSRRVDAHPIDAAVAEAITRLEPRFVIHFAGARRSEYQIRMWLPYFDLVGDPYIVIVRERYLMAGVAEATTAPIVLVPAQSVLDRLLPESVGACFYSNHAVKNAQLVKLDQYTHVQLMHGDSDKAISRSPVSQMYDRVFVAGQAGIDRYHRHGVDIPNYKFRKIGRPQLHQIQVGPRVREESELPTVLYTPTWAGLNSDVDYSSLNEARRVVEAVLRRDVRIIFRTHPYTASNRAYQELADQLKELIAADAAATGRDHWWGPRAETESSLTDCINAADVAISDISGTASDWLYCGRPLAMTDPRGFGGDYLEEFPLARAAYLLETGSGNIEAVLDELLVTDSLAEVRAEVREYYLGDIAPDDLIDVFRRAVKATYDPTVADVAESGFADDSAAELVDKQ
ncbi:CDP-glycerol glycerophosphotransferase family protein [Glycomyces halotolerans]